MTTENRIALLLKQRIGLDPGSVGNSALERALRIRMTATGLADPVYYWESVQGSAAEQQALIDAVVVPETWFFRYPESFRTLGLLALQRAVVKGRPLRLLSAPCSTGEEPYSMAMALFDVGLLASQFSIDALDISQPLLDRASTGLYGRNSFRSKSLEFRDRYFSDSGNGHALSGRVRDQVRLRQANLLDPGSLLHEMPYDFVFCRNLLIYFDQPTQLAALHTLTALAQKDGYLFVGPAEASLLSSQGLQSSGVPMSFAFKLGSGRAPQAAQALSAPTTRTVTPPATRPASSPRPASPALTKPAPGQGPVKTDAPRQGTVSFDAIVSLANAGRTGEALRACEQHLAAHGPSATLFYWFGVLSEAAGRPAAAQEYYRKALYLDPGHQETLAQMTALLTARGDDAAARRMQARAARGANKHG